MPRELRIKNLALIEDLQVIFVKGLTVLTGETGAGKTIVLQAVQLLAGERGTSSWVRTCADSAGVEDLLELENKNAVIEEALGEDLDPDNTIILKRVLSANGKSRFYINGNFSIAKMAGPDLYGTGEPCRPACPSATHKSAQSLADG
jgi:DNA repair protein RecN (Recombination protein N)